VIKCKLEDEVTIEHKIQRHVWVFHDRERKQMTHFTVIIDEKEKFDDEMSEVSSISSLSESHRDDKWERCSQRDSRASHNRLLTHSQWVTSSLATSSLTSRLSSRSSSSLSVTLSLRKKIFTDKFIAIINTESAVINEIRKLSTENTT